MKKLIDEYTVSCEKVRSRINTLSICLNRLEAKGDEGKIRELDLVRRINLLRTEYRQTLEIIEYMKMYVRRIEPGAETCNIF